MKLHRNLQLANKLTSSSLLFMIIIILLSKQISAKPQQQADPKIAATTTTAPATAAPTTTTTTTTSPSPQQPISTTTIEPVKATTSEKDVLDAKRAIKEHITVGATENRIVLNKPTLAPQMVDYAPESQEARVADSTTQFGLSFINSLQADAKDNLVISPLSLQNLLNMILLGAKDDTTTQKELTQTLGYDVTKLLSNPQADRLKPHEAMHNVLENIIAATHLSVSQPSPDLLNTNAAAIPTTIATPPASGKIGAHLQTSSRQDGSPLTGQVNFTLANLMLTNTDRVKLNQDYENELKLYYKVKVEEFSLNQSSPSTNSTTSVQKSSLPLHERVNKWVKLQTANQIAKLAEESDLNDPDLIMVLLNAAHFKGRWLHTFNTKATSDRTFFNAGSESGANKVKFMRQKGVFGYADFGPVSQQTDSGLNGESRTVVANSETESLLTEDKQSASGNRTASTSSDPLYPAIELSKEEQRRLDLTSKLNCSALMLPFSLNDGQELSMVLLLPSKRDGIDELIGALNGPALNEIYRSLSEQQVQVEIPKFSFEGSHDAKSTLLRMGLKSIFLESLDLNRMLATNSTAPIKVNNIVHKAKIAIDESGAEAAAASMATIVMRNYIRPPTPSFVADHPFLFIIRHNRSNMPLFMGRVSSLS